MNEVYVPFKFKDMQPMEAIIEFYKKNCSIQEIVNAFIDSEVKGYNRERIKGLIRNYVALVAAGEYERPTDIELEECAVDVSDGVFEPAKVYVHCVFTEKNVVEAIVTWYEKGVSIANMVSNLQEEEVMSYSAARIQEIIKIYKRLKKSGIVPHAIDIELEECAAPAKKAAKKSRKSTPKAEIEEDDVDFDEFDEEEVEDCAADDSDDGIDPEKSEDDFEDSEDDEEVEEDYTDYSLHTDEEIEAIVDDPLPIFRELNNNVMMVGKRLSAALLVTGSGGIGKSYAVQRVLNEFGKEKKDYVIMKGKCTASAMYNFLFRNHDKICVFDDCDSVLCDKEGLAVLKGALDSGKSRDISWNTRGCDMVDTFDCDNRRQVMKKMEKWSKKHGGRQGIPTQFQFEGSVIFISNMTRDEIKAKDSALLTRCAVVDVSVSNEDVIERLGALLPKFQIFDARGKSITNKEIMNETFDWISSEEFLNNPRMDGKSIDFRLFIKTYKARYARISTWREMAFAG